MIHPSYSELIQAINNNAEEDDNTMMLNSRYSLVLATSKRARQLIAGAEPDVYKRQLSLCICRLWLEATERIMEFYGCGEAFGYGDGGRCV